MSSSPQPRKGKRPEAPAAASARPQPAVTGGGRRVEPAAAPAPPAGSAGGSFFGGLLVGGLAVAAAGAVAYALGAAGSRKTVDADGGNVDDNDGGAPDAVPSGSGDECVVCLSAPKSHAFVPCGHVACCSRCAGAVRDGRMQRCPVCRALLEEGLVMRVYK
jgi:hypothetical protein